MAGLEAHDRIRLGIVTNELFESGIGRMGGFGWVARRVAQCFSEDPSLGVDPVLLMGEWLEDASRAAPVIQGSPVLWRERTTRKYLSKLRRMRLDSLLTIDYRPNYRLFLYGLPRTPVIFWVHDPRDNKAIERIRTLKIPGAEDETPQGILPPRTASLAGVLRVSRMMRRPFRFAVTTPCLADRIKGCYKVDVKRAPVLPNIISLQPDRLGKSKDPLVVFLGRLDPIKRPWIFAALGKKFPEVQFVFMGQNHFHGPGAWDDRILPPNVRKLGHTDEAQKVRLLSSAWVLINTSIHEALPISLLESLACETPIIGSVNPDDVVSLYGAYVGYWPGTGMDGLPAFESALRCMLNDKGLRERLGREGRDWVNRCHNRAQFLRSMRMLLDGMGKPLSRWVSESAGTAHPGMHDLP